MQISVLVPHYQNEVSTSRAVIMVMQNLGAGKEQKLNTTCSPLSNMIESMPGPKTTVRCKSQYTAKQT